jgi:hypothetical protein
MKSLAYPHLDRLVDLACRDGVDVRPTLLRVLTDLYVQKPTHSADEITQYVELALGLVDTVDDATRAAVAASLSGYVAAPPAVLARLGMTAPAAAPVSAVLPDVDFASPATAAQDADTDPATAPDLTDLFFSSSTEDRRLILLYLDAAATTSVRLPTPASADVIQGIENAALARNTNEFSRLLERALCLPRGLGARIAADASGEPIVVAAKALGMKAAVLQRVLLFLNPAVGQSVQRVYDLADLFDELTREAAERMLAIWRDTGAAAAPAHQPVYGPDGKRDGRVQSASHREVRTGVQEPARLKSTR